MTMNPASLHRNFTAMLAGFCFLLQPQSSLATSSKGGKIEEGIAYTFFANAEDDRKESQDAKFDSLKSILSRDLKGEDEFARNDYKPMAEKKFNELLAKKFQWVGTFDLPEYDFASGSFHLLAPSLGFDAISNLYGCMLTRRVAPMELKIDAMKAKAMKKAANGRYQVKIIFSFVGIESKQDVINRIKRDPNERFLAGWDPQSHCDPIEGRIHIGSKKIFLNLGR